MTAAWNLHLMCTFYMRLWKRPPADRTQVPQPWLGPHLLDDRIGIMVSTYPTRSCDIVLLSDPECCFCPLPGIHVSPMKSFTIQNTHPSKRMVQRFRMVVLCTSFLFELLDLAVEAFDRSSFPGMFAQPRSIPCGLPNGACSLS